MFVLGELQMQTRKKVFIGIILLMLVLSMVSFAGCTKKSKKGGGSTSEYDAIGLPLTKNGAIELWKGDWKYETTEGGINTHLYRNDIKDGKYLVFGNVEEIMKGTAVGYENKYERPTDLKYDVKTRTLYISRVFDGYTVVSEIRFINKNKVYFKDNVSEGAYLIRA